MTFRTLYAELNDYQGRSAYEEILVPWLNTNSDHLAWLQAFKQRQGAPVPAAEPEELWHLYALSRCLQILCLSFQIRDAQAESWQGPHVSQQEFSSFAEQLGFELSNPDYYSPIMHEVIDLQSANNTTQEAQIIAYRWPALMLGPLLLMQAGVDVSAGTEVLKPGIADKSTLHWAYRRNNRDCSDLSHGWGHNSQWRTAIRRDYLFDGVWYLNVDGKIDLAKLNPDERDDSDLSVAERQELLLHRSFVRCQKDSRDAWPYEDTLIVKHNTLPKPAQFFKSDIAGSF